MSGSSLDFDIRTPSLGDQLTAVFTLELVNIQGAAKPFAVEVTLPDTVASMDWTAMSSAGSVGVPASGTGAFSLAGTLAARGQAIFTLSVTLNSVPIDREFQSSTLVAEGGVDGESVLRAAQVIQGDDSKVLFRALPDRPFLSQALLSSQFFDLDETLDPIVVWQFIDKIQNERLNVVSLLLGSGGSALPPVDADTIQDVGGVLTAIGGRIIPGYLSSRSGTLDTARLGDLLPALRPELVLDCSTNSTTAVTVPSTAGMRIDQSISGANISPDTRITDLGVDETSITISNPALTTSGSISLTFGELDVVSALEVTSVSQTAAIIAAVAPLATTASVAAGLAGKAAASGVGLPWEEPIAIGDEGTAVTTGTAKITFRMPCNVTLNAGNAGVRLSANTASSSGLPTVDVNVNGSTILSTKVTLDVSEKTSLTATTPVVISSLALVDDDEITIDVDVAGTGTKGLKLVLRGVRA